jgi:hypothetical protein
MRGLQSTRTVHTTRRSNPNKAVRAEKGKQFIFVPSDFYLLCGLLTWSVNVGVFGKKKVF